MWKCKDHMEIRGINHLSPAFIHPYFGGEGLAVRAAAVAAGVVIELDMSAVRALAGITAEPAGLAVHDGMGRPALDIGEENAGGRISVKRGSKYLPDLIITHEKRLLP